MSDGEEHSGGLVRDIFGGSDSELSSEDEAPPRRSPPARGASGGGEESGDDYVQEKEPGAAPKKKKKASRRRERDEGDAMDVDRPSRKRKRKAPPPKINLDDLPPEEARKMKLDMQIEAILKGKKTNRPKKRKNSDEDILDRIADDEVIRLKDEMNAAVEADIAANKDKLPGTAKLRMLPQVMEVLQKTSLVQAIIDNNLLECVRRWLEPLPDKSLPALNIQTAFFDILGKMDIDTNTLKESRLGRIVLFYTRCKRVTTKIRRQAEDLVAAWSRPIIKRSASYRDRHVPTVDLDADATRTTEKLNAILARGRAADVGRIRKNAVSIPQQVVGTYTVAPRSNIAPRPQDSVDLDIERRKRNAARMRNLTRRVQQHQKEKGLR
ncbi:hypothetical protein AURDEDRAFT_100530 [Auricularia subglabra TFB-10046 SS5]|nr:hypothetical protein AURDEDRAFT_100530 [Auricularia subglabra TFB-10046 SS5]